MTETAALTMNWEVLPSGGEVIRSPDVSGMNIEALGQRFSELISAPEAVVGVENHSQNFSIQSQEPKSLGKMVIAKLDAVGMEFKKNMERAHSTFDQSPKDISLVDALRVQYEMAVVTLHVDVVGKGVQKSVQNVETFLKMQ